MTTANKQVYFDDVKVGMDIPNLIKGPMTQAHIMRWSASQENWHRIHYDHPFSLDHEKLPNVLINGSWKQQIMCQLVKDWVGLEGWLWKISFQHRSMNVPGDLIDTEPSATSITLLPTKKTPFSVIRSLALNA